MKHIVAVMLVLCAASASGEVGLSLGSTGAMELPGAAVDGEIAAGASGDLYRPLAGGFALLADAAADVRWLPVGSQLVASGSVSGELSLERGCFLGRIGVAALGERAFSWGTAQASGPAGELSLLTAGSWSGAAATLEGEAGARVFAGDRIAWSSSLALGLSGALGGGLIMSVEARAGAEFPADGAAPEPILSGTASAEWLPPAPFVLRVQAAVERRLSKAVEPVLVGTATVDVAGYWGYLEARTALHLDAILGRRAELALELPASWRLTDHGVITATEVLAEREWRLEVEPSLELGLGLSARVALSVKIADRLALSNAAAMTNLASAGVEARLTLP